MTQTTPWFPGAVKPARSGWYEVRENPALHYNSSGKLNGLPWRYWTGKNWMTASPDLKWSFSSIFGNHSAHQWRGLTKAAAQGESKGGAT